MLARTLFILFLAVSVSSDLPCQQLQFFREMIEVDIDGSYCWIHGAYYFMNKGQRTVSRSLYYPFVVNAALPFPDSIYVRNRVEDADIRYSVSERGVHFPVRVPPASIVIYDVSYHQPTPKGEMEYILTTTKHWKRGLEYAEYTVCIPRRFELTELSIPFNSIIPKDSVVLYHIQRKNFMPGENLRITWRRTEP